MKFLVLPLRFLYCIYALLTFVALMLIVIPFVLVGSFFGKITGGNFIYLCCCTWGRIWNFLIAVWHRNIYEAPHDKSRQYIFVANHISYFDAPVIVQTITQPVRILGKAEMAKVPLFGSIYRRTVVTVDRSSPQRRAKSVRVLKSVIKKGISIFIFPEGTFNETNSPVKDFYDGAFRIAIETQTPIKPLLFLDSYDRMHYGSVFSLNPGRSRSVFLQEIPVEGMTIHDLPLLKQKVYAIMEQKLVEYRASWIKGKAISQ